MIDVVVIDDHALMRSTIKELLGSSADMRLVGEAEDGMTGFQLVTTLAPSVVVVDINISGLDGITLTRRLKAIMPKMVIIGVSAFLKDFTCHPILDAGAYACLDKQDLVEKLVDTVRASIGENESRTPSEKIETTLADVATEIGLIDPPLQNPSMGSPGR